MFYWGADEYEAVAGICLAFASTYVALDLVRVMQGAPRGWYLAVAGFSVLVIYEMVRIGFAVEAPDTFEDQATATLLLLFGIFMFAGLALLDRGFRKQSRVLQSG